MSDDVSTTGQYARPGPRDGGERVLVIGDGATARALGGALARAGGAPVLRWARREGGGPPAADVVVLAVTDAAVSEVAGLVMAACGSDQTPPILLHCAGSLPPDEAFASVSPRPLGIGLLHPLRALAGTPDDTDLAGTLFAVMGDGPGRDAALRLVARVGGLPIDLGSSAEALGRYHAAAALASNHTLALVDAGLELLESAGLPRPQATSALASLLASTVSNLGRVGLPAALTGAMARGDVATVARHLLALRDQPALLSLYRATGRRLLEVAAQKGRATPEELERLRALLVGE